MAGYNLILNLPGFIIVNVSGYHPLILEEVFHSHTKGVSQKDLAKYYKKGKVTIERWYQRRYRLEHQELTPFSTFN